MTHRWFPTRRDDGTVSVAPRLRLDAPESRVVLNRYVDGWLDRYAADHEVEPLDHLSVAPFIDECDDGTVEVVFEGRSESQRWKDLMVNFMEGVPAQLTFIGFYDRVAGQLHPGSFAPE